MSITWNGVSSDTIGVIVERIPNRYVPTRRFSPQQVAGRNGNILLVDKSFPNVEQEYEVYLSAEAQGLPSVARACAEWLMGPDGYCRLTDSYDTTVYREAFLMGGYDLENILNKFGRCTITFSCKPQKHLLTGDTPISIPAGSTATYTGSSVQFDGITGASITSLSTTITPTQDLHGYANPWPTGGGVNLFDTDSAEYFNGIGTNNSKVYGHTFTAAGTYALKTYDTGAGTGSYVQRMIHRADNTWTNAATINNNGAFETLQAGDTMYVFWGGYTPSDTDAYRATAIAGFNAWKPQVALSSTQPSQWHPYSNVCPISGSTGLSVYVGPTQDPDDATEYAVDWSTQAGTVYGGTLDVVTGVLTVDRVCVDGGDLTWVKHSSSSAEYRNFNATTPSVAKNDSTAYTVISSVYRAQTYDDVTTTEDYDTYIRPNGSETQICVKDTSKASLSAADFKTAMVGVQFCYELATPLTYQLTPQEIGVLVGENNVWASDGTISVTVSTPLGGFVTNPTPFEARPLLEVSGVGEITINGKSIQILESVSDFQIDCEAMEAEDNSKIYCMDFPYLEGGENVIVGDGSITALTVTPRWWTL